MSGFADDSPIGRITAEAERRFVRWDRELWEWYVHGPAQELARGLQSANASEADLDACVTAYLRLLREGVGLGYVGRPEAGAHDFLSRAFSATLPAILPTVPPLRRVELLAKYWNLGENLEHEPPWLQHIVMFAQDEFPGHSIEELIAHVASTVLSPPAKMLDSHARLVWMNLQAADRRFLPGRVLFAAPTVAVVVDRLRDGQDGRPAVTVGVWLRDDPVILGAMAIPDVPAQRSSGRVGWDAKRRADHRLTDLYSTSGNDWRELATLVTSQYVVAALP